MNEKSFTVIKLLLKIITNTLKKVLFSDDKNTQHVHNICCSWINTDLRCNFIVMILTRTGLHRKLFALTLQFKMSGKNCFQ